MNPSGPDAATQIVVMHDMADNGMPVLIAICLGLLVLFWSRREREIANLGRWQGIALLAALLLGTLLMTGLYAWQWMQPPYPLLVADRSRFWCSSLPADDALAWRDLEAFSITHKQRWFDRRTFTQDIVHLTVRPEARGEYQDAGIRRSGDMSCSLRLQPEDTARLQEFWRQSRQPH